MHARIARSLLAVAVAAVVLGSVASAHALFDGTLTPSKCIAGKVKCLAKLKSCLVSCHQKALTKGLAVDAACLEKCRNKFDESPAVPGRGCFARLEAKGGCGASVGDAAVFAAKVEAQVREAMQQLVPAGGNPLNKCTAGKTICLRKYGSCILGLVRKAAQAGAAIGDVSKCTRYLAADAGSCVAKLETRYCEPSVECSSTASPCLTFDDAVTLRNQDDAFTDEAIAALETGPKDVNTQRCTGDTSVQCTSAPGGAAGCGGPLGTCEFFFSVPSPAAAGGVSFCMTRHWIGSLTGTFDQATGESAGTAALLSRTYSGIAIATPCPRCVADAFPNDGLSAGTCAGGTRNGQACDANARSPEPTFGATSLDCPPSGGAVAELRFDLDHTTGTATRTVSATSPSCNGVLGKTCLCGRCTGDATLACGSDAECALAGAGTCTSAGGEPQKPHACVDDPGTPMVDGSICAPIGGGRGECPEGPVVTHCRIETFRSCVQDADCPLDGDGCADSLRACFPGYDGNLGDSISATGRAGNLRNGATPMAFAAVFCLAPSSTPAVNASTGLPSPGRLELAGVGADDGGPGCPTTASFLPTSKGPVFDVGWVGIIHDLPARSESKVTVATTCTGTYPACECSYTGPIANPNAP